MRTITTRDVQQADRDAFLASCPGWSVPYDSYTAHYFNGNGVSLCLKWDWRQARLPNTETKARRCKVCERHTERGTG